MGTANIGTVATTTANPKRSSVIPEYIGLRENASGPAMTSAVGFSCVLCVVAFF